MKRSAKMMMLNNRRDYGRDGNKVEIEMRQARDEYHRARGEYEHARREMDRARDRSGSFGYSPERGYYPITPYGGSREPEGRFRDRTGREHYDNGRYAPMRDYYAKQPGDHYNYDRTDGRRMIGFATPEMGMGYESRVDMPKDRDMDRKKSEKMHGWAEGVEPLTMHEAREWVDHMKNADGTMGAHYTMEQTRQIMEQNRLECDEVEFYTCVNMMYSDYCKVAKKFNCNTIDFYACMAEAFLNDKDAQPEKLALYYDYIVKK